MVVLEWEMCNEIWIYRVRCGGKRMNNHDQRLSRNDVHKIDTL